MSAISSVGSDPLTLFANQQQAAQSGVPTPIGTVTNGDPMPLATPAATPEHHHHHGGGMSSQIESAVTTALQNAAPGSDPNQTIQNAITAALQGNANDTTTSTSTSQSATTTSPSTTTSQSSFEALLQSNGIDPQQFQQDFKTALASLQQNGSVDFATLFHSFPPGAAVDTAA